MSENNNAMTTITKNPLVIIIVVVVIIIGIVLIVKMSRSEEAFSPSSSDTKDIVENFPQSTPMNVMYSDANGNLGTTTDLGLQNLTIGKDGALLLGNKFRFNANKDAHTDDEWLRMMNPENTGYSGGFAAGKLYGGSVVHSDGTMYSRGDITAGGKISAGGDISTSGNINMPAGSIIGNPGRMHIHNKERLYILPKDGVWITNDWGGTGDLTVTGNTSVGGVLTSTSAGVSLSMDGAKDTGIGGPTANTRINSQGIIFGGANNGREANSAQITAGRHEEDVLCIVGMSKPDHTNRRIRMWAEGGTRHDGPMSITGSLTVANRDILAELDAIKKTLNIVKTDPLKCMRANTYISKENIPRDWGLRHFLDYGSQEGRSKNTIDQDCASTY